MPVIDRHIRIGASPWRVWDVLVDIPGQPRWMRDLVEIELVDGQPFRQGSRAVGTIQMFGLRQRDPIVVTAFEPPSRYAMEHQGAFSGVGTFELRPLDGGRATHVHWREELRGSAMALPLGERLVELPLVGGLVRRAGDLIMLMADPLLWPVLAWVFRADLRRLKQLVEDGTG